MRPQRTDTRRKDTLSLPQAAAFATKSLSASRLVCLLALSGKFCGGIERDGLIIESSRSWIDDDNFIWIKVIDTQETVITFMTYGVIFDPTS